MTDSEFNDLKYPVGEFRAEAALPDAQLEQCLKTIEDTPASLRGAVKGLTEAQLDTPYRDGGWTVRQVIHHVADSHMQSYSRFRFALTEAEPVIKPYDEATWAELPDAKTAPIELSLLLLDALHARWMILLRSLDDAALARVFVHPEMGSVPLLKAVQLYAWHGRHHTAHITRLRERSHW
jgi:uncharacterized damage-inducible protein DinB